MTQKVGNTLGRNETNDLISSENVDGTPVYNPSGERLGSVKHLMIGKSDGCVRYAVLSFGGMFGFGERYYPLPWSALTYRERQSGYVVNINRERLENAPSYERGQEPTYDSEYGQRVYNYHGVRWLP